MKTKDKTCDLQVGEKERVRAFWQVFFRNYLFFRAKKPLNYNKKVPLHKVLTSINRFSFPKMQ